MSHAVSRNAARFSLRLCEKFYSYFEKNFRGKGLGDALEKSEKNCIERGEETIGGCNENKYFRL